MEHETTLFSRIVSDATSLAESPAARAHLARWAVAEPGLIDLDDPRQVFDRCWDGGAPLRARATLSCLLRLAGDDPLARRAVLVALAPVLGHAATALVRAWYAEPDEIDQALASAAWARICRLAGSDVVCPVAAIVGPARDEVRASLRTESRRQAHRVVGLGDQGELALQATSASPELGLEVADLFTSAVRRGIVSLDDARLVVATRALGDSPTALARARQCHPGSLRTKLCRAEAALRAAS